MAVRRDEHGYRVRFSGRAFGRIVEHALPDALDTDFRVIFDLDGKPKSGPSTVMSGCRSVAGRPCSTGLLNKNQRALLAEKQVSSFPPLVGPLLTPHTAAG
jgi:hypothetical protein